MTIGEIPKKNPKTSYEKIMRKEADRLKADLYRNPLLEYDYQDLQIELSLSRARQIGRRVLEIVGFNRDKIADTRRRESMSIALREYKAENEDRERSEKQARENQERRAEDTRKEEEHKRQERAEEQNRLLLESQMGSVRDRAENLIKNQRAQELFERDLNARLLTVDKLEEATLEENPGVVKKTMEYEGTEILVYNLVGMEFSMLSSAIDYRITGTNSDKNMGSSTAENLIANPSLWVETREKAESYPGFGSQNENARGDTISASYVNSESNIDTRYGAHGSLRTYTCYGFDHVDADQVILVSSGDAGSVNTSGKTDTRIDFNNFDYLNLFEGPERRSAERYNEILLRRYDIQGHPKKPDYIISENGKITDVMLKHAKFFGIPIVNIERSVYEKKMRDKVEVALQSASQATGYHEINSILNQIRRTSLYNAQASALENFGREQDEKFIKEKQTLYLPNSIEARIDKLNVAELKERIEFIESTLQKAITECHEATSSGKRFNEPSGFSEFNAFLVPRNYSSDPNCVSIHFRESNSEVHSTIITNIYDETSIGKRAFEQIAPLIKEYTDARKKNTEQKYLLSKNEHVE